MDINDILPHRPPMRAIDTLREWSREEAVAVTTFAMRDYGVEEGFVTEPMLVELVAQTAAAHQGVSAKEPRPGLLASIDDFEFLSPASKEWELTIHIKILQKFGVFYIIEGQIRHDGETVARGQVKLYVEEGTDASQTSSTA